MIETVSESAEVRIFDRRPNVPGEPKSIFQIVQIAHGYAEHVYRYGHVTDALPGVGVDVCAIHLNERARHEVLRETDRTEVISDLAPWIRCVA